MKWKPAETDVIDYLYGSMTVENKVKFEEYMAGNPEFKKEVNELRQTQNILPSFQDEEVIPPLPLPGTQVGRTRSVKNWLYPVSIAASIAIILLTGYLTNFRMSFNDTGFELGFQELKLDDQRLTQEEVEKMIAAQMDNYESKIDSRFVGLSTEFDQQLRDNQEWTVTRINEVAQSSTQAQLDDAQVLQFMSQLQAENNKMMQNFYMVSSEEQKTYLRNILLEFSDYIEKQRQEDIQYIQASFRDSERKQQATDMVLANIISTVNDQNLSVIDNQRLD